MEDSLENNFRFEFLRLVKKVAYNEVVWSDDHKVIRLSIDGERPRLAILWAAWKLGLITEEAIQEPSLVPTQPALEELKKYETAPAYLMSRRLHRRRR